MEAKTRFDWPIGSDGSGRDQGAVGVAAAVLALATGLDLSENPTTWPAGLVTAWNDACAGGGMKAALTVEAMAAAFLRHRAAMIDPEHVDMARLEARRDGYEQALSMVRQGMIANLGPVPDAVTPDASAISREAAMEVIEAAYGAPGTGHETEEGRDLVLAILEQEGLAAFATPTLERLAAMHMAEHDRHTRLDQVR